MRKRTNIARQIKNSTYNVPVNLRIAVLERHPELARTHRTGEQITFVFSDRSRITLSGEPA